MTVGMSRSGCDLVISTLRHAPTDFGESRIIAGHLDPPLSQAGIAMAKALRDARVIRPYDRIVSSPLRRALRTATLVAGVPEQEIVTSELCIERNYGMLQGLAPDTIAGVRPETFYVSVGGIDHSLNPPGGETLEQLRERVVRFHREIVCSRPGAVLVVGHATFLQQYHGYLKGEDVYHALKNGVMCLELNEFALNRGVLVAHERIYAPDRPSDVW